MPLGVCLEVFIGSLSPAEAYPYLADPLILCLHLLQAFFNLASVAAHSNVDLWSYSSQDGRSIRKAFEWMIPYALGKKKWPFKQIADYSWGEMFGPFRRASIEFNNKTYEDMISSLPDIHNDDVINLLFPRRFEPTLQEAGGFGSHEGRRGSYVEVDGVSFPRYFWSRPMY